MERNAQLDPLSPLGALLNLCMIPYEDLSTVLIQAEACLNSRPLCALSSSHDSYEALTPGHFIIGQPLNMIPEPNLLLRGYVSTFWNRWRDEYLGSLQPRKKWQSTMQNLETGELVLVKTDNTSPAYWELARISAVHPDRYGVVRNVTLRRGNVEYQRPIHKLVVLPLD